MHCAVSIRRLAVKQARIRARPRRRRYRVPRARVFRWVLQSVPRFLAPFRYPPRQRAYSTTLTGCPPSLVGWGWQKHKQASRSSQLTSYLPLTSRTVPRGSHPSSSQEPHYVTWTRRSHCSRVLRCHIGIPDRRGKCASAEFSRFSLVVLFLASM